MQLQGMAHSAIAVLRSSPIALKARRSPVVERLMCDLRQRARLVLPEIGISLDVARDDLIVDCGAHVGQLTSRFARTGAYIHAFEPNPGCYRTLASRFRIVPRVTVHHAGVLDRDCTLSFRMPRRVPEHDMPSLAGSFDKRSYPRAEADVCEVTCIDIGKWVLAQPRRVRLMKLDIEGSEIVVINRLIDTGAIEKVDLVVCETHEQMIPELRPATEALAARIEREGLSAKFRLDWP